MHSIEHVATELFPQALCLLLSKHKFRDLSVCGTDASRNTAHMEGDTGPKSSHHPDPQNLLPSCAHHEFLDPHLQLLMKQKLSVFPSNLP